MFSYFLFNGIAILLFVIAFVLVLRKWCLLKTCMARIKQSGMFGVWIVVLCAAAVLFGILGNARYPVHFAMPPFMHSYAPGQLPASIPLYNLVTFFQRYNDFERISDIGADPNAVPEVASVPENGVVHLELTAQEVISEIAEGIYFNYWTYNGQVPGPFLRVKAGDTIQVTLHNHPTSIHTHNIDLHAVNGPGGGASATAVAPGETKSFQWKALNPGIYVYHCATPNVSTHNSHGQFGLILVEPAGGLPSVDKEFYVMQGELYTVGSLGKKGLVPFDSQALLDELPTYVTFNGRIETTPRMQAEVGDRVRIYVGNGGVSLISSFHVIGEIFDLVYPEGAIGSPPLQNVQTTAVLPGGASIVEFTVDVPGKYLLVDHALSRMNKGAWAVLEVSGTAQPDIFSTESSTHEEGRHE